MAFQESNRGIARNFIPGLLSQGLSGAQTLRTLREFGIGYREQDFYNDWREFTGREQKKDTYKYLRPEYKPSLQNIQVTHENLSTEYEYFFTVKGRDKLTGETVTKDWRLGTDELITRAEAEESEAELQDYMVEKLGIEDISVTLSNVTRAIHL